MSEAILSQAKVVRAAIERTADEHGMPAADIYVGGLLVGIISYLIRTRGRRGAYRLMCIYADEILTPELPQ